MDRVEDMRSFVAELTASHVNRSKALHDLSSDVQSTLRTFQSNRNAMAADMQEMLEKARNDRVDAVTSLQVQTHAYMTDVNAARQQMSAAMFDSLRVSHEQMSGSVVEMLGQFSADRKAMSEAEQAALAAARADRQAQVADLKADAQVLLQKIAEERKAMADALGDDLAQSRAQRQASVMNLLAEFQGMLERIAGENRTAAEELFSFLKEDNTARRVAVSDLMAGISADRQAMSQAQAVRLNDFKVALEAEVDTTIAGIAKERTALHESLQMMGELWREYAAFMRGQGMQGPAAVEAPATEVEEPEVIDGSDVEREIIEFLETRPEGAKLVEMEPVFGLSRPVLGRYLRKLVDAGSVVKDPDTLLYKLA